MITTIDQLREWFLEFKLPESIARIPEAMERWEIALSDRSLGKIYAFWAFAGMDRYIEQKFSWDSIHQSNIQQELF